MDLRHGVQAAPAAGASSYDAGVQLYQAGRYGDAIDSFDTAVKHKDHAQESQGYIDRIRKENRGTHSK